MKVLTELLDRGELRRRGFTHFLALTYGADLPWFEEHLGRQLGLAGIRRMVILADQVALDAALPHHVASLTGAGRWYSVQGLSSSLTFHPKAYLLAGPGAARLYVGSGNLNLSGLGRNREIFERWDTASGGTTPKAFEAFRRYVLNLMQRSMPRTEYLEQAIGSTFSMPSLAGPWTSSGPELHGSPGALVDMLPAQPSPAKRLIMTAPFFDQEGEAVRTLASRLGASSFDLLVDRTMTNLLEPARRAIMAAGGRVRALADARRSHAKALFAEGEGWALSVHGSANFSNAAWRGHNAELVVLRTGEAAQEVGALLDELSAEDLADDAWAHIHARAATTLPPGNGVPGSAKLLLHSVRWLDTSRLILVAAAPLPPGTVLSLRSEDRVASLTLDLGDGTTAIASVGSDARWSQVQAARLELGELAGPWVIVHDVRALQSAARGRTLLDDRVDGLVASRGRGSSGAQELLELLTELLRQRAEASRSQSIKQSSQVKSDHEHDAGPEWHWLEPQQHQADDPDPGVPEGQRDASMAGGDPARLIERLILGDARVAAGQIIGADRGLTQQERGDSGEDEVSSAAALAAADQDLLAKPDLQLVATRAREAFVAAILRANLGWPAEVLLADLLLLTAALQDALRQGQLTDAEYARHMIEVLSAVLGQATAPYPKALESVPLDQRPGAWARGWLLVGPLLVAWQVLLAQLAARSEEDLEAPARRAAIPLWVRGLIRYAPVKDLERLLEEAERQLPSMERFGALWVADRWPYWAERLPLRAFLREVVSDALALERLEVPLGAALREQAGKQGSVEEDDLVIGRGRDGGLAVGFMDSQKFALLCDGAFQDASAREPHRRLRRVGLMEIMTFEAAERALEAAPEDARASLGVLEELAP